MRVVSGTDRRRRKGRRSRARLGRASYENVRSQPGLSLRPVGRLAGRGKGKGVSLVLLLALLWLLYYLFASDQFYVYGATVIGNLNVPAEEIYRQSGLDGLSIFFVSPQKVAARVARMTHLRAAQVETELPNRVIIRVRERQPQIIWQVGEARYQVDREGVLLPAGDLSADWPVIEDMDGRAVRPGERIDPALVAVAQTLHRLLPDVPVFEYSRATGLSFTNEEGWQIRLSHGVEDPAVLEGRVAIYQHLARELLAEETPVTLIDLRYENYPYYR